MARMTAPACGQHAVLVRFQRSVNLRKHRARLESHMLYLEQEYAQLQALYEENEADILDSDTISTVDYSDALPADHDNQDAGLTSEDDDDQGSEAGLLANDTDSEEYYSTSPPADHGDHAAGYSSSEEGGEESEDDILANDTDAEVYRPSPPPTYHADHEADLTSSEDDDQESEAQYDVDEFLFPGVEEDSLTWRSEEEEIEEETRALSEESSTIPDDESTGSGPTSPQSSESEDEPLVSRKRSAEEMEGEDGDELGCGGLWVWVPGRGLKWARFDYP
ncbi:unnamed protein product [Zymoseptoria tritici ST99CH_3D7]|uniref:Uncharacterized protein n=1 Tax=Zymoseptoria tritici (strain ST99CH_3D7) TaxID=1276538 RepID=A0A1X7RS81_ZYMT9|nr:unnamed protein product [Zymoseptoria tritici ST99CH_3D7]